MSGCEVQQARHDGMRSAAPPQKVVTGFTFNLAQMQGRLDADSAYSAMPGDRSCSGCGRNGHGPDLRPSCPYPHPKSRGWVSVLWLRAPRDSNTP